MRKSSLATLAALAVFALVSVLLIQPATAAEEMDGKALFVDTYKCSMCHSVPAAEIEAKMSGKMAGPELGGKVEVEFEKLAAFLRKAGDLNGEEHNKEFKGTDEELQAIVDWLGSLEAAN